MTVIILNVLIWGMIILLGILLFRDANEDIFLVRLYQGTRFFRTRLPKVLYRFGIDPYTFMHSQDIAQIKQLTATCQVCPHAQHCEHLQQCTVLNANDYGFCPNRETLQPLLSSSLAARRVRNPVYVKNS